MSASLRCIDLRALARSGRPGVDASYGRVMARCAAVCLHAQGHVPPGNLKTVGHCAEEFTLDWVKAAQAQFQSYAEEKNAVARGACGIAILIMEVAYKQTPVFESVIRTGVDSTGIDYWMSDLGDKTQKYSSRLEISGINKGTATEIRKRRLAKITQSKKSDHTLLPAYIIIVEFGSPLAKVDLRCLG